MQTEKLKVISFSFFYEDKAQLHEKEVQHITVVATETK